MSEFKKKLKSTSVGDKTIQETFAQLKFNAEQGSKKNYKFIPTHLLFKERVPDLTLRERELLLMIYLLEYQGEVNFVHLFRRLHVGFCNTQLKLKLNSLKSKGYIDFTDLSRDCIIYPEKAKFINTPFFSISNLFIFDLNISAKQLMILAFFVFKPTGGFVSYIAKKIGCDRYTLKTSLDFLKSFGFIELAPAPKGLAFKGINRYKTCNEIFVAHPALKSKWRVSKAYSSSLLFRNDSNRKSTHYLLKPKLRLSLFNEIYLYLLTKCKKVLSKGKNSTKKGIFFTDIVRERLKEITSIKMCAELKKIKKRLNAVVDVYTCRLAKFEIERKFDQFWDRFKYSNLSEYSREQLASEKVIDEFLDTRKREQKKPKGLKNNYLKNIPNLGYCTYSAESFDIEELIYVLNGTER